MSGKPLLLRGQRPKQSPKKSAWKKAEEYGIDMSLLEHSLGLSLEERVLQNQVALEFMLECERAGREYYAKRAMGLLHPSGSQ